MPAFDSFFAKATGTSPFPFQRRFAEAADLPQLVRVPTGLGKTAMALVGWMWRRFGGDAELRQATPRRLVYCLPMRVLVEQTRDSALDWLDATGLLAGRIERSPGQGGQRGRVETGTYRWDSGAADRVAMHVLMGGEDGDDWDLHPERDAIIIGTQDMLVSRALNRGYAAARSRWPVQFGLLNTDCLWIFDEIQLMGVALATTAQLEAFRRMLPGEQSPQAENAHGCRSVWMSATMQKDWLETVDFRRFLASTTDFTFNFQEERAADGLDEGSRKVLNDRWNGKKPLTRSTSVVGESASLAKEILDRHKPATRTIAVVNTVQRARDLYDSIARRWGSDEDERLVLLHSRFRPDDREEAVKRVLADPPSKGTVVVSTQVIEAGVDVSATTLFTELAPWSSLVQRFGRCNRRGVDNERAQVFWVDLPPKTATKTWLPYELEQLVQSTNLLTATEDVGLATLPDVPLAYTHTHVIRRKDLIDLFDTTSDLAGNDIDIDRFVRETDESDVRVFWRDYSDNPNQRDGGNAEAAPRRDELCPAPIGEFKSFITDPTRRGLVWRWSFVDRKWESARKDTVVPGQVYLLHSDAGGYTPSHGWKATSDVRTEPVTRQVVDDQAPEGFDDDVLSRVHVWRTIAQHTDEMCNELETILEASPLDELEAVALRLAGRWHDWGKAHPVFQDAIHDGQMEVRRTGTAQRPQRPTGWRDCRFVAKAPGKVWREGRVVEGGWWRGYGRKYFRHELASALAILQRPHDGLRALEDATLDLMAYLTAAHHGKVRLSIRSFPNETKPLDAAREGEAAPRFARGVWDGDELPATDLGGGFTVPAVRLSLEPMELGLCEIEPFAGEPSWSERMIRLRDTIGPFRLAYLEAMLRAADMRASQAAERSAPPTNLERSLGTA